MTPTVTKISFHPFTNTGTGGRINTYAEGYTDAEVDGWNVQSLTARGLIIDDEDFDDLDTAWQHAQNLAQKYRVEIS